MSDLVVPRYVIVNTETIDTFIGNHEFVLRFGETEYAVPLQILSHLKPHRILSKGELCIDLSSIFRDCISVAHNVVGGDGRRCFINGLAIEQPRKKTHLSASIRRCVDSSLVAGQIILQHTYLDMDERRKVAFQEVSSIRLRIFKLASNSPNSVFDLCLFGMTSGLILQSDTPLTKIITHYGSGVRMEYNHIYIELLCQQLDKKTIFLPLNMDDATLQTNPSSNDVNMNRVDFRIELFTDAPSFGVVAYQCTSNVLDMVARSSDNSLPKATFRYNYDTDDSDVCKCL